MGLTIEVAVMKTSFQANLEQCEPRLMLSSAALLSMMESAAPLALDAPADVNLSGSVAYMQPEMYQFTADSTTDLIVRMSSPDGKIDPVLRLYDANGHAVRRNNNAARGTRDSQISYQLQAGQTYYLQAATRTRSAGDFALGFRALSHDDYGDTMQSSALVRMIGNRASVSGKIDSSADADMFKLVSTLTGTITVDTTGLQRMGIGPAVVLKAYNAAGQQVALTSSAGSPYLLGFNAVSGQTYYLQVSGANGGTGVYNLRLTGKAMAPAPQPNPNPDPVPADGSYAPGAAVAGQIVQNGGTQQLVITGTNGADSMVISQTANGISLAVGSGTQNFSGVFSSIVIYGFGGNDCVRLNNTVATVHTVYAGDGDDQVFDASMAAGTIDGGAGNDLIVSIGGGADRIYGGTGLDSIWCDSAETVADLEGAEQSAASVHKVGSFYQPWSSNAASPDYVSTTIAGQNLKDPALYSYATGWRNFSNKPLFAAAPSLGDISQGSVGDCYFMSSLASLADQDPMVVQQMIAPLGDGSYAVRFYRNGQPVYMRIDADLPVNGGGGLAYAGLGKSGSLWAPLLEKAYAFFRYDQDSYDSLNGGWMSDVYLDLANASSSEKWGGTASAWYTWIKGQLDAGHAVTLGSKYNATGPIWGSHAYMVKSAYSDATGQYVVVYNPWGVDGKSWDSNSSDGLMTLPIALIAANFAGGSACQI